MEITTAATGLVSMLALVAVGLAFRSALKRGFLASLASVLAALGAGWILRHFAAMPIWFLSHIAAMLVCWCLMIFGVSLYTTTAASSVNATDPKAIRCKKTTRIVHGVSQSFAVLFAVVGYYCMYHQHAVVQPGSQIGLDPNNTWSRIIHVWLGYAVIVGMLIQGCQGWFKFENLFKYKLHAKFGITIVVLAGVNVSIILSGMIPVHDAGYGLLQASILGASGIAAFVASNLTKTDAREFSEAGLLNIDETLMHASFQKLAC